jgi:hypothetical protein
LETHPEYANKHWHRIREGAGEEGLALVMSYSLTFLFALSLKQTEKSPTRE